MRPAPLVYVPDLEKQVFQLLDQNNRLNNGTLPTYTTYMYA